VEEEEKQQVMEALAEKDSQLELLNKKVAHVQNTLAVEEDAKRRMLLRYIHSVKEHALAVNGGTGGIINLPESNISDEELHALGALLRNNMSIEELNLRGNQITDDGARALGAVLAGRSALRVVDLRGNKIGPGARRVLAEALERSERVRHVYVHAGGKIEALGAGKWAVPRSDLNSANKSVEDIRAEHQHAATVETVCVVDCRDNNPEQTSFPYELERVNVKASATVSEPSVQAGGKALKRSASPTKGDAAQDKDKEKAASTERTKLSQSLVRSVNNLVSSASTPNIDLDNKKARAKVNILVGVGIHVCGERRGLSELGEDHRSPML
jgi:hypothetical protein